MMKLFRYLLGAAVVCGLLAGGFFWYQSQQSQAKETPAAAGPGAHAVPVEAVQVTIGTVERVISAVGTLESNESVILRPEIAGRIERINFQEGTPVKRGDTLFQLDDSIYEAEAEQAQASLELSRKNYDRARELHKKGAGTASKLDETQAQLRVDEAGAAYALTMLDKTRIRAPFDGIVGLRSVSVGDYVSPGQDLVNLESIEPVKLKFSIPQTALTAVSVGQTIEVTVDSFPGKSFQGEIYAIDPLVDEATRTLVVRARIPNPDRLLRPGLFVTVKLTVEHREGAVLVPEQAIVPQGEERLVFRVVDGKAEAAPVTLGQRQNAMVEITEGLGSGDVVVVAGYQKLRNGAPVMVLNDGKVAEK